MAKHTLKILRCSHYKIFKVCLAIFDIMYESVKAMKCSPLVQHDTSWKNIFSECVLKEKYFNRLHLQRKRNLLSSALLKVYSDGT